MTRICSLHQISKLFEYKKIEDSHGNEYVLFEDSTYSDVIEENISDRTAFEAFENHRHVIDRVSKHAIKDAIPSAKRIAEAVHSCLVKKYPNKHFMVYVAMSPGDSLTLRFHQKWPGEEPFCYVADFENSEEFVYLCEN